MLFFEKTICPYCFSSFNQKKIMWRCNSYQCRQPEKLEEDKLFYQYHKSAKINQPHILENPKCKNGFATCDKCNNPTNMKICPECHSSLPTSEKNIIISIIGAPGAGKSYYVGSLLKQLRSKMCKFGCSFTFTTKEDETLYNAKFNDKFENGLKLEKTQPPTDEDNFVGANMPILCNIQDSKSITRTFTFFDAAGENFDDKVIMAAIAKYLGHSTAILLLLDPLQIKAVQCAVKEKNAKSDARENENIISYDEILDNTINVIHSQLRLPMNKKIKIPIAVAFSKWDLIQNSSLHDESSIVEQDSPHFREGFSEIDCNNVSLEIEAKLAKWECEDFINKIKNNFETYKFFAVSSIGAAPEKNGKVPKVVSRRVEDPFLWLLRKQNIIV